jgi:hypothetical protein
MTHPAAAMIPGSTAPGYLLGQCAQVEFSAGEAVHRAGHRYQEMYVVVAGHLQSYPESEDCETQTFLPGAAIGDLGFLGGYQARADVIARTQVRVLVVNENTFSKMETEDRQLAVHFRRLLASITRERESPACDVAAVSAGIASVGNINVLLCRDESMMLQAQRLRYSVYCDELGRDPPEADHSRRIISDTLDEFSHTFIALEGGEAIGTLRTTLAGEGPLGILEDLYGMTNSVLYPAATALCTKFYIKKSKRRSPAFLQLGRAWLEDAVSRGIRECFLGAVPSLAAMYKVLGFRPAAPRFYHLGDGPSDPMVLDLKQEGKRLSAFAGLQHR